MMRRTIPALAILVMMTGGVLAQTFSVLPNEAPRRSDEDVARDRQIEQQYRSKMQDIPDKQGSKDPWGNVRSTPAAKSAGTATKKQQ